MVNQPDCQSANIADRQNEDVIMIFSLLKTINTEASCLSIKGPAQYLHLALSNSALAP